MSARPQIPDPAGVQDQRAVDILRSIKSIVDSITGRLPTQTEIKTLGDDATLAGVINKVNEILARIQK